MENRDKLPVQTSTKLLITPEGDSYLSKYTDGPASDTALKFALSKLSAAFPQLDKEFLVLLASEIRDSAMTTNQLHDAVTFTIRNVHFPKIADILGYDRKVKLYKYYEIVKFVHEGRKMSDFEIFDKEKKLWIEKTDKL